MNQDIRILIVDDEHTIRDTLRMALETNKYKVRESATGSDGMRAAAEFHPHLILLDLGLPDMNGSQVLKDLRKWTQVPVIILTAAEEEQTKVNLLDAGADDYLTKPFGPKELLARIRVALRNGGLVEATPIFVSGSLRVNLSERKAYRDENEIKLTSTEYELLSRLARDHGKIISQAVLLRQIWGVTGVDQNHYVRIYINQLRKKIEENPAIPRHILTEPGVGYRLV